MHRVFVTFASKQASLMITDLTLGRPRKKKVIKMQTILNSTGTDKDGNSYQLQTVTFAFLFRSKHS